MARRSLAGVIEIGQPKRPQASSVSALAGLFDLGCGCDGGDLGRVVVVDSSASTPTTGPAAGGVSGGTYTLPNHTLSAEDQRIYARILGGGIGPQCVAAGAMCSYQTSVGQLPYKVTSSQQFYYNKNTRTLRVTANNPTWIAVAGGAVWDFGKSVAKSAVCIAAKEVAQRAMMAAGCGDPPFSSAKCRAAAVAQAAVLRKAGCGVPAEYSVGDSSGGASAGGGDWKKYLPLAAAGLIAVVILARR